MAALPPTAEAVHAHHLASSPTACPPNPARIARCRCEPSSRSARRRRDRSATRRIAARVQAASGSARSQWQRRSRYPPSGHGRFPDPGYHLETLAPTHRMPCRASAAARRRGSLSSLLPPLSTISRGDKNVAIWSSVRRVESSAGTLKPHMARPQVDQPFPGIGGLHERMRQPCVGPGSIPALSPLRVLPMVRTVCRLKRVPPPRVCRTASNILSPSHILRPSAHRGRSRHAPQRTPCRAPPSLRRRASLAQQTGSSPPLLVEYPTQKCAPGRRKSNN